MSDRNALDAARSARLYHRLQLAAHAAHRMSDRVVSDATGFTTAQVSVLSVLTVSGPCTQRAIAAELGLNEPAVAEMVSRLEQRGCVAKRVDPSDSRARLISLTETGRDVLRKVRAPFREVNDRFASALTEPEVRVLADLLERVHHQFSERTQP